MHLWSELVISGKADRQWAYSDWAPSSLCLIFIVCHTHTYKLWSQVHWQVLSFCLCAIINQRSCLCGPWGWFIGWKCIYIHTCTDILKQKYTHLNSYFNSKTNGCQSAPVKQWEGGWRDEGCQEQCIRGEDRRGSERCDCYILSVIVSFQQLVSILFSLSSSNMVNTLCVDIEQTGLGHRPITCLHIAVSYHHVMSEVNVEDKREAVIHKEKIFMPTESVSIVS